MTGTVAALRLLFRRYRFRITLWVVPLVALVAVTVPSYAGMYPSLADRGPLVAELRSATATKVLYGELPLPGTLGQLAQWETGAYLVLLTAVMAIVLTVAMTRGDEDSGRTELSSTAGVGRWARVSATALLLLGTFAVLGSGVGGVMALQAVGSTELTAAGCWSFGAVIALVGVTVSASTFLLAEVLWDSAAARIAAWSLFAVEFGLRIAADFGSIPQLRWFTWAGLKDLVRPFTDNRPAPLIGCALAALLIGGAAVAVHSRREFGAGVVRPRAGRLRRLSIHSTAGLAWRLGRAPWVAWSLPTMAIAALFGGLSHNLVNLIDTDPSMAQMMRQLTASGAAVRQYFEFSSLFIVLVVLAYGVHTVLQARGAERDGTLDAQISVGVRRWRPLATQTGLAALGSLALLVAGGCVQSAVTAQVSSTPDATAWAWWAVVGHAPGVALTAGLTALLVGVVPRFAEAAWAVVAWSGFAVFFGALVRLPGWARDLSVLGHGPLEVSGQLSAAAPWFAVAVLVGLAVLATAAGLEGMNRRDAVLR